MLLEIEITKHDITKLTMDWAKQEDFSGQISDNLTIGYKIHKYLKSMTLRKNVVRSVICVSVSISNK